MKLQRSEVMMPGGIELALEAEKHVELNKKKILSVACGTGEIELYFVRKYHCRLTGIDISEKFIAKAHNKAGKYKLSQFTKFLIGNGSNLVFNDSSFDVIICIGALCAFYYSGLSEFYRVLKLGGKAIIIDLIWAKKTIPIEIKKVWAGDSADIFTEKDNVKNFMENKFKVILSSSYDKSSWWEAYYEDRGNSPIWEKEKANYRAHKNYLNLGLFILEKS